jgi:hypothetical protein
MFKIIWSYTDSWVVPVQVIHETEHTVTPEGGFQMRRKTQGYEYHATWESAHAAMVERAGILVADAQATLDEMLAYQRRVNAFTNPDSTIRRGV